MSLKNITLSVLGCVTCSPGATPLAAGDTVKLLLRQDLLGGALPTFITGTVQTPVTSGGVDHPDTKEVVAGTHYTIQYESDDLLGVIDTLEHCYVSEVICASCCDLLGDRVKALEECVNLLKVGVTIVPPEVSLTGPNGQPSEFLFTLRDGSTVRYIHEGGASFLYREFDAASVAASPTVLSFLPAEENPEADGSPWWAILNNAQDTQLWTQIETDQLSPVGGYDDDDEPASQPGVMSVPTPLVDPASTTFVITYVNESGATVIETLEWDSASGREGVYYFWFPKGKTLTSVVYGTQADIDAGYELLTTAEQVCFDPFWGVADPPVELTGTQYTLSGGVPSPSVLFLASDTWWNARLGTVFFVDLPRVTAANEDGAPWGVWAWRKEGTLAAPEPFLIEKPCSIFKDDLEGTPAGTAQVVAANLVKLMMEAPPATGGSALRYPVATSDRNVYWELAPVKVITVVPAGASSLTVPAPAGLDKSDLQSALLRQTSGAALGISVSHIDTSGADAVIYLTSAPAGNNCQVIAVFG